MTQELGDLVGLSAQQIRRIETGQSELNAVVLGRIAWQLGTSADELLDYVRTIEEPANLLWEKHKLRLGLWGRSPSLNDQSTLPAVQLTECAHMPGQYDEGLRGSHHLR